MVSVTELKSIPMLVVAAVFLAVSWIFVSLRIYVRTAMIRAMGWDDWLMIVTQILFTVMCALIFIISGTELSHGVEGSASYTLLISMVAIFGIYILATITFKLSLAIFFLRVVHERWQRQLIYASATLCTVVGLVWFFVALFQCGNPGDYMTHELEGKCLDFNTILAPFNYIHGSLNAVTDWIFAIVPIFVVRKAQMSPKAKASVIGILALGAAGSITSLVRLAYVHVLGVPLDRLYIEAPRYAIVSIIELGFGITAASMATLRPLFSQFLDKATYVMRSSQNKKSKRGDTLPQHSEHGIVMERSVNVGYEENGAELKVLSPLETAVSTPMDSPVGRSWSAKGRLSKGGEFLVSVDSTCSPPDWSNPGEVPSMPQYNPHQRRTGSTSSGEDLLSIQQTV